MRKRLFSLLCTLALCLGLLPVTALAEGEDAPGTLCVGNQLLSTSDTTFWTTDNEGKLTESTENENWNVKYDSNSNTLTLNGATIKTTHTSAQDAVIYAESSQNSAVSLTIVLQGDNTINCDSTLYGIYVNAEANENIYGTDASLTIRSDKNGSLEVSGSQHGIYVKSGSGNASLTIENASVAAKTTSTTSYYAGVYVRSSTKATSSPQLSLAVNGGSLTASGGSGNSKGIWFYVGSPNATDATTSLTVSGNAIVDAKSGGISAEDVGLANLNVNVGSGDSGNGGIVFDGTEGTVYGDVTLDESLTINQGETLIIPEGSKLDCNNKLTNNGTILVESGGTLSGGTTLTTPTINTHPQAQEVTAGETAEFSVTASDAQTYQWQQSTDNGSSWADINGAASASYTTAATTTGMNNYQYRCMVTGSGGVSVISDAATLTVKDKPVTPTTYTISADVDPVEAGSVTVNGSTSPVSVVANSTVNLVADANPGYHFTGWTSSNGGTFGDASSASTTFTMPAADVTVTANFKQVYTVTVHASAGGTATGGGTYGEGDTVTLTATPASGYHFAGWSVISGGITITDNTFTMPAENVEIQATFARNSSSGGGGSRPTPTPTPSQQAVDKIESAKDGDTVTIDLPEGKTTLEKEVFEELAGRDVTLVLDLGDGVSWTVNGLDIPADAALADTDMGVSMNAGSVPVDIINAITGEVGTLQMTLAHDGDFGFTLTLTAPLGTKNAGYWANLYYFDEAAETLTFQTSARIGGDGSAALVFTHASQYVIVIDDRDHTPKDFPFVDVTEGDWCYEAVDYVFQRDLMTGTDATHFTPDGTASRAMVATILWRMAGQPQVNYAMDFADVPADTWYTEAVRWAAAEGIVTGYSAEKFGPDDPVTREQFAVMLYRYAQTLGKGFTGSWSFPLHFPDADQVSDYAYEALCWMTMENVIQGMEDGGLHPQGTATRAQLATMLQRFCQTADL